MHKGKDKKGFYKPSDTGDMAFEMAWLKHCRRNKHHWQYWVVPECPEDKVYEMPRTYVLEMVCFSGDTKIALLNGQNAEIKDLVNKKSFWVYSYDISTNSIVPGKASKCRKIGFYNTLIVTLDNGERIKCTPNHKFLLSNNHYIEARFLKSGDSLKPLYRKVEGDYEQILNGKKWQNTHRMVFNWKYGGKTSHCYLAHHKDFNKLNNSPQNILATNEKGHLKYHSKLTKLLVEQGKHPFQNKDLIQRNKVRMKELAKLGKLFTQSPEGRKMSGGRMTKFNLESHAIGKHPMQRIENINKLIKRNKSEVGRKRTSEMNKKLKFFAKKNLDPNFIRKQMLGKCKKVIDELKNLDIPITENSYEEIRLGFYGINNKCGIPKYCKFVEYSGNHKIALIEDGDYEDVYDFTVEKYHNFALTAGVFTHNCDWRGAGKAQGTMGNNKFDWFDTYKSKMKLHENTISNIYLALNMLKDV